MRSRRPKTVLYRRKRERKTNYAKRLKLLLARKNRLVVRFTNKFINAQLVKFTVTGDITLVGVNSLALKKLGWNGSCNNLPAAYLFGLVFGKSAIEKGHKEAILDTGFKTPLKKGKAYAFLKGVIDAGLNIPVGSEEIFPDEERLYGNHINENLKSEVEKIKQKIMG